MNQSINQQINRLNNVNILQKFLVFQLVFDDAFFNRNWAGACGGRWAEPGLMLNRSTGRASSDLGFDCCCADRQVLDAALPCKKNQKEEGPAGASPVAATMLKSDSY